MLDSSAGGSGLECGDLSFRQAIRIVRRNKYIVIGTAFALAAAVLIVSFMIRPCFSSTAAIEIEQRQNDLEGGSLESVASSLAGDEDDKTLVQTEVLVLQNDDRGIETIDSQRYDPRSSYSMDVPGGHDEIAESLSLPISFNPPMRHTCGMVREE
jgi:hypothetical protein